MRFAPDREQQDMADTLRDLLADADTAKIARAWSGGETAAWWEVWRELADVGVTGLTVPQDHGGLEFGPIEMALCLEELGYAAMPGPLIESLAFLPRLLPGSPWLAELAGGRAVGTAIVAGHLPFALDADQAGAVFRCDGDGVHRLGGTRLQRAESFDPARRLFAVEHDTAEPVEAADSGAAFDRGVLGCAAYLLGLGRRLLDTATEYVKQRHQFGRPVGEFQAVKHHLANVLLKLEFVRPLVRGACLSVDGPHGSRDVSAAKIAAGEAARTAARTALQVHGAIGYTAEHDLHLWLTKATALRSAWGTPAWHRARVATALATDPAPIGA
ncbi:acyl-CoA dehydrogenase family protein [Saccharopolyspora hirsuta]|uniref:Acyl-CoA dehydrogenase n=1 Tax=Saccharopolyspora hirsuta TaxID=1837 RepID=A0A5M7BC28_SACHI|nr:acyl-CoA dehydrogenase family protein [Saccharopolyspora hirsuta]KAA5825034.1 acyl-CoA dehydrogenase [Saccharopolyspora hirsuta]